MTFEKFKSLAIVALTPTFILIPLCLLAGVCIAYHNYRAAQDGQDADIKEITVDLTHEEIKKFIERQRDHEDIPESEIPEGIKKLIEILA